MKPNTKLTSSRGEVIHLTKRLASGGEGEVWETNQVGKVAKIYKHPINSNTSQKLKVMLNSPPRDPNQKIKHISYAWPLSLLKTSEGKEVGFLMPQIPGGRPLLQIYSPKLRQSNNLKIDWRFLHYTAMNVASLIQALHESGYVLGDIKPQNMMVNRQALPSIIDTDSFQVRDQHTGTVYRCLVTSPSYTPPELYKKDLSQIIQNESHDRFRLAVLIYSLLFSEETPFKGKWVGKGQQPPPSQLTYKGWWPYAKTGYIQPGPSTIPLEILDPPLKDCFLRAFNQGHNDPTARPSAKEWKGVLKQAIANLRECNDKTLHFYSSHQRKCYWCQRSENLGPDIFKGEPKPFSQKVKRKFISFFFLDFVNFPKPNLNTVNSKLLVGGIALVCLAIGATAVFRQFQMRLALQALERGNAYFEEQNLDEAKEAYAQAIEFDSNLAEAYFKQGNIYYEKENWEKAIANYNQAVELNPDFSSAYNNRGNAYWQQNQLDHAIANYQKALKSNPDNEVARRNLQQLQR